MRRFSDHSLFVPPVLAAIQLAFVPASPASAQHPPENVVLLSHLDRGEEYSGNWGYTALDGTELAISGTMTGTTFIDATVPTAATEVAFIPGPTSIWREMSTYSHYCYIVTEGEGAALQVVDLSNPLSPTLAITLNPPALPFSRAHEIKIDQATGLCYAAGTRNGTSYTGLVILDLNPDPLHPVHIGTWPASGWSTSDYVHDLSIFQGKAYCAAIYAGTVFVLDVTQPGAPPLLAQWTYPSPFTHNTWPSRDGSFVVTTDENPGGHLRMWDVRDLGQVTQTDEWAAPTGALVHNAYLRGNICFMSHYQDGLRVVDASDPYNLRPVGWYDTHPMDGGGTRGAWGCYCFAADSTIAYISDRDTGTYILRYVAPPTAVLDPELAPASTPPVASVPNPFRSATRIQFEVAAPGPVTLRVYDASGRLVRVLAGHPLARGRQDLMWDGRDGARAAVASGVYYYRLSGPGLEATGRMVLSR